MSSVFCERKSQIYGCQDKKKANNHLRRQKTTVRRIFFRTQWFPVMDGKNGKQCKIWKQPKYSLTGECIKEFINKLKFLVSAAVF